MSNLNGFKQWQELFDENVSQVWKEEAVPILKNISMVLFCITREFKKLQHNLKNELSDVTGDKDVQKLKPVTSNHLNSKCMLTQEIKGSEGPESSQKSSQKSESLDEKVHNEVHKLTDSPSKSSHDESIVNSEDELRSFPKTGGSPEIKKTSRSKFRKKIRHKRKINESSLPTANFVGKDYNCESKENHNQKKAVSVKSESMLFLEKLAAPLCIAEKTLESDSPKILPKDQKNDSTPIKSDSDFDTSVIQSTPGSKVLPHSSKKMLATHLLKKRIRNCKTSTLTQMFTSIKKEKDSLIRAQSKNYDSDETNLLLDNKNKTKNNQESVMGLTRMVSYFNQCDSSILNSEDVNELVESVRFDDDTSLNSAIIEDNQSEPEEENVSKDLNEFLAKAQNVPNQLEAAPVVRGNARKKLPGWVCKDCEQFYLKQGLNADEILALNKCTKHRGFYKPREDTLPGYWDMDMGTETDTL